MFSDLQHEKKFLQNNAQGHMHFGLLWDGENPPTRNYIMQFPITGTVKPKFITILSNTS